ncbi:MAG: cation-translocating P-type ATPase, partial [Methanothrix sp.]|nr:cation-translocating P-type ATPase [Methanothrix sp.]
MPQEFPNNDPNAAVCRRRHWTYRYREFLLDPGTIFTFASGLLLVMAVIRDPAALFSSGGPDRSESLFYLAAALVGSSYIWWSALQGIRERDFTADIPVSIATFAAIFIGEYVAAAVVAVLLLLGGLLEDFVAARANQSMEALTRLLPDQVTVRRDDRDVVVCIEEVEVGDLLLVRSGERIAVDGEVVSGTASVNQAAITGESIPVDKRAGDLVYAGTLNEVGALEVRATGIEKDTTLGKIRTLIEEAQAQKPPIERLLNRYAQIYMPTALIAGALLWWWSGDVMRAITMLIVFCPCVIVLATPTALVAAVGNAALRGSLIKKGATVEALSRVDTVVFDKTGTLTSGRPKLVAIHTADGMSEGDLLEMAAAAEKFSEHPLGRAAVQAASERWISLPDPEGFEPLPGLGVRAQIRGEEVFLGRLKTLVDQGHYIPPGIEGQAALMEAAGQSVILISIDGEVAGLLAFEDEIRAESRAVVERLHRLGLRTAIVTGDNRAATERVAGEIGIEE